MRLESLLYTENHQKDGEWRLQGLRLRDQNLIVGINASGKSRTLGLITVLARLVAGDAKPVFGTGEWEAHFEHQGKDVTYSLEINDGRVTKERFLIDGVVYLDRGAGGKGTIQAEKINQALDFQAPDTDLAVVNRRDSEQHPFFEPLFQWGREVYNFAFSTDLGKSNLTVIVKDFKVPELDPRDTFKTAAIFLKGVTLFGDKYRDAIKQDMERLKYPIDEIGDQAAAVQIAGGPIPFNGAPVIIYVRERDLTTNTGQLEMSNGMFRALALVVQLNYSKFAGKQSCIIIDDIGEGLDFERSCLLIELVREKALDTGVQLIMSTNDRFVMNSVPLEDWSVIRRNGGVVQIYNYQNSKPVFDRFEVTGLNNFDFFAMEFIKEGEGHPE